MAASSGCSFLSQSVDNGHAKLDTYTARLLRFSHSHILGVGEDELKELVYQGISAWSRDNRPSPLPNWPLRGESNLYSCRLVCTWLPDCPHDGYL